eukprot:TRINITY_DN11905_c0_g1_i1.p1 TRINITY_DN11905_c0_g1~~TRINITY_DN11905_c0_g1_i1.p1  ORF type:complete len:333 (-),score=50.29 TRINITY_DN11905_c0_g1_i1:107-1075(-)
MAMGVGSKPDAVDMKGKVVIVTGGNAGIGFATCQQLAEMGAHVIMACRDPHKAQDAVAQLFAASSVTVEAMSLDLASFASIKSFVAAFEAKQLPLHVLICNAGILTDKRQETADGLEMTTGVCYFGHFLLVLSLLETMKRSSPARIVVLSSKAAFQGDCDMDNITFKKSWSTMDSYNTAKFMNVMFATELQRRLDAEGLNITANSLHPGVVWTGLGQRSCITKFLAVILCCCTVKPEAGAYNSVWAATSTKLEGIGGKYIESSRVMPAPPKTQDPVRAAALWARSEEITGVTFPARRKAAADAGAAAIAPADVSIDESGRLL